jgi:hypothetical protein
MVPLNCYKSPPTQEEILNSPQIITEKRSATKSKIRAPWWDAARTLLVACLVLSVMLGTQPLHAQDDSNPIVTQLVAAGLVTPIDVDATINGVDVTINWVYADANQVIVTLTMRNLDYSNVPADTLPAKEIVRVATSDGGEFSYQSAYATFADTPKGLANLTVTTQFYPQVFKVSTEEPEIIDDYFATLGPNMPTTVDLQLMVDIATNVGPQDYSMIPPGEPAELTLPVTVTLHPGITLTPQTTVTASDLDVTLQQLTITPSQTSFEVCYDLPDGGDWQPVTALSINDQAALLFGSGLTERPTPQDTSRCSRLSYGAFYDGSPVTVTVTVEALRTSMPETRDYWESVRDELATHEVVINVLMSGGRYYEMVSFPDTMSEMEANNLLWQVAQNLLPRIDGPWTFILEIGPEA